MSYKISILNIKGGVGKSTIAFNLAAALTRNDKHVLLIDIDLQCNLTDMAAKEPDKITKTVFDLLTNQSLLPADIVYESVVDNIDIIPGDLRLIDIENHINPSTNPKAMRILDDSTSVMFDDEYDYIIIDCRPEISVLTMNAILASNFYIVPVVCDRHSLKGIQITDRYIASAKEVKPELTELGILINNLDGRKANHENIYKVLKNHMPDRLMKTIIRTNSAIERAASMQQSVFQYDLRQRGCEDFRKLANEVIEKVGDNSNERKEKNERTGAG